MAALYTVQYIIYSQLAQLDAEGLLVGAALWEGGQKEEARDPVAWQL